MGATCSSSPARRHALNKAMQPCVHTHATSAGLHKVGIQVPAASHIGSRLRGILTLYKVGVLAAQVRRNERLVPFDSDVLGLGGRLQVNFMNIQARIKNAFCNGHT